MILNYNNALNANFKIAFPKISDLEFYAHSINVPTIQLNPIEVKYQDSRAKVPDNFYSWDDVTIQFMMDEEFYSYELLLDWNKKVRNTEFWQNGLMDIHIIPLDSNKNIEYSFYFHGAWPSTLMGWQYSSTMSTSESIIFDVLFAYQDLTIKRIKPLDFSIV